MRQRGFTLIELLVVIAVISLLITILAPSLGAARQHARAALCLTNFHQLGVGIAIYSGEDRDALPPGRLPKIDNCNYVSQINGGKKYRPTFIAIMSRSVNAPPFDDPQPCANTTDRTGEAGDRQNYSSAVYVCPSAAEWTDERNAAYGYNYQFLGNSRLRAASDPNSFKNWPVRITTVRDPSRTVAAADCLGTAASFPPSQRLPYSNNGRNAAALGEEGFNLDPPRVDPANGEMAGFDSSPQLRTAVDGRHRGKAGVLWLDAHASTESPKALGYRENPDGSVALDGDNSLWIGNFSDVAWTPEFRR